MLTLVQKWERGEDIFGHASFPAPWVYVAFDRSLSDVWDTLEDIGFSPPENRIHSCFNDKTILPTLDGLIKCMDRFLPKGGLFLIDGLGFIPVQTRDGMGQYQGVWKFVMCLTENSEKRDVTAAGNAHNPKQRKGEEIVNPRDRILGSVAWGATCGTVLALDNLPNGDKKLSIMPRSKAGDSYHLLKRETSGKLIFLDWRQTESKEQTEANPSSIYLDNMLCEAPEEVTREMMEDWAGKMNITIRTVERWVKAKLDAGELKPIKRGLYVKPKPE